jgi:glycerophosphoryl diester phosphodiesterase
MGYGSQGGPLAIAHRGGAGLAPENTLAAFAMSAALGLRYLETDVRLTRDGALVCFHDSTLDRVTEACGRVDQWRLADLRHTLVEGREPIPTLAEAFDAFPDCNFTVDLKDEAAIAPLASLLRNRADAERVCVAGAWDSWLARLKRITPGVHTALGWRSLTALICASRAGTRPSRRFATGPFAHVPVRLGSVPIFVERLADHAHRIGVRVNVWTVDDPHLMHELLDMGVDGIITDRPDVLREVLIARNGWTTRSPNSTIPVRV